MYTGVRSVPPGMRGTMTVTERYRSAGRRRTTELVTGHIWSRTVLQRTHARAQPSTGHAGRKRTDARKSGTRIRIVARRRGRDISYVNKGGGLVGHLAIWMPDFMPLRRHEQCFCQIRLVMTISKMECENKIQEG